MGDQKVHQRIEDESFNPPVIYDCFGKSQNEGSLKDNSANIYGLILFRAVPSAWRISPRKVTFEVGVEI